MIQTNRVGTQYSDNVIDPLLNFNTPQTWSVTSGTGSATISGDYAFEGNKSLWVQNANGDNDIVISNSVQNTVIPVSGSYGLNLYLLKTENKNISGKVKIFKNNVLFATESFANFSLLNKWVLFTSSKSFVFAKDDIITFTFQIDGEVNSSIKNLFIDGIKLYRQQTQQLTPPFYTKPISNDVSTVGGWIYSQDDNSGGNQVITTTPTKFTINGLGASTDIEDSPDGSTIWNTTTNKLTPSKLRDNYAVTIDFTVVLRTSNPIYLNWQIDIGGTSSPTIPVRSGRLEINKTAPFKQTFTTTIFCKDTFLANGGQIFLNTDVGSCEINAKAAHIVRTFKKLY